MSIKALPNRTERPARSAAPARGATAIVAPRVDLLPPEIGERNRQKAVRRGLRFVILAVLVLVLVGIAGTWVLATGSQTALVGEQAQTQNLIAQQAKFADVRSAQDAIILGEAAQRVGGSTEIDWRTYLTKLQATLPAGVYLKSVTIDSASATTGYVQSQVPLEGARIATLTFTAVSPTLPSVPSWLDRLATMPGFVDATPGSVVLDEGGYIATITLHINSDAYSNRFSAEDQAAAAGQTAAAVDPAASATPTPAPSETTGEGK